MRSIGMTGAMAVAVLMAAGAGAQTQSNQTEPRGQAPERNEAVIAGCVERQSNGTYRLTHAVTLTGTTAVGTAGTTDRTARGVETWTLQTMNDFLLGELAGHVNEQVEIRGSVAAPSGAAATSGSTTTGTTENGSSAQSNTAKQLNVGAIAAVASSCP